MDRERRANLTVKADGAHAIVVETEFIDPHYTLEVDAVSPATDTGLVSLFRVAPDDLALPGFAGRWDDRTQAVDIDPDPIDSIPRDLWTSEQGGYRGHHTHRRSEDPRVYGIDIGTPSGPVFKGRITLNIQISLSFTESLAFRDEFACEVVAARPPTGPAD